MLVEIWGYSGTATRSLASVPGKSGTSTWNASATSRFRSVIPGAVLAVVLWAITSVGFSFYLATFANYGVTYGSLGAAVGLLFYLYLSASVVLFGAELNAAIYRPVTDGGATGRKQQGADPGRMQTRAQKDDSSRG